MYFNKTGLDDLKTEYRELCKVWHPDVTKESYDTTPVMIEINLEYQRLLRKHLFGEKNTINRAVEEELRTANCIYVNVYKVFPHMKPSPFGGMFRYHEHKHWKSFMAKNEKDAQRLLNNMKHIKLYTPYLTDRLYELCDRIGFVYRIEYGPVVLRDFFSSGIKENEKWRERNVIR